jgi:nucleotide-binding universal stress UspA family protein
MIEESLAAVMPGPLQPGLPILVAVTDDGLSEPAVLLAQDLAKRRDVRPRLVYVMELSMSTSPEGMVGVSTAALSDALLDSAARQRDEQDLRKAIHLDVGLPLEWPFDIELGAAASCIVERANISHSAMIVMGLHRHSTAGRLLGNDTVREVIAIGGIPVIAARTPLAALPKSVVVAVDFSRASLHAAALVRQLMDEAGTMHLVFIKRPSQDKSESAEGRRLIETHGVTAAFNQLSTALRPGKSMTITSICRQGNTITELKRLCAELQPDLLAIGSQRHSLWERLRLGSIASAMLQDSRWSMLITPPKSR